MLIVAMVYLYLFASHWDLAVLYLRDEWHICLLIAPACGLLKQKMATINLQLLFAVSFLTQDLQLVHVCPVLQAEAA